MEQLPPLNSHHHQQYHPPRSSPTPTYSRPQPRSTLTQLAHRIFPSIFALLALTMLDTILIFALWLHRPMPRNVGIRMGGAFVIIIALVAGCNWLVWARQHYSWGSGYEGSSRTGSLRSTENLEGGGGGDILLSNIARDGKESLWKRITGAYRDYYLVPRAPSEEAKEETAVTEAAAEIHSRNPRGQQTARAQLCPGTNVSLEDTFIIQHPLAESVHGSPRVSGGTERARTTVLLDPNTGYERAFSSYSRESPRPNFYETPRVSYESQRSVSKEAEQAHPRSLVKSSRTESGHQDRIISANQENQYPQSEPRNESPYVLPPMPDDEATHIRELGIARKGKKCEVGAEMEQGRLLHQTPAEIFDSKETEEGQNIGETMVFTEDQSSRAVSTVTTSPPALNHPLRMPQLGASWRVSVIVAECSKG